MGKKDDLKKELAVRLTTQWLRNPKSGGRGRRVSPRDILDRNEAAARARPVRHPNYFTNDTTTEAPNFYVAAGFFGRNGLRLYFVDDVDRHSRWNMIQLPWPPASDEPTSAEIQTWAL